MNEFNNRISAQREILQAVNRRTQDEELFGLSGKAIDRWIVANRVDTESRLVGLIRAVGDKLFFLANKSQEQITEDYQMLSAEVAFLHTKISQEIGQS